MSAASLEKLMRKTDPASFDPEIAAALAPFLDKESLSALVREKIGRAKQE